MWCWVALLSFPHASQVPTTSSFPLCIALQVYYDKKNPGHSLKNNVHIPVKVDADNWYAAGKGSWKRAPRVRMTLPMVHTDMQDRTGTCHGYLDSVASDGRALPQAVYQGAAQWSTWAQL